MMMSVAAALAVSAIAALFAGEPAMAAKGQGKAGAAVAPPAPAPLITQQQTGVLAVKDERLTRTRLIADTEFTGPFGGWVCSAVWIELRTITGAVTDRSVSATCLFDPVVAAELVALGQPVGTVASAHSARVAVGCAGLDVAMLPGPPPVAGEVADFFFDATGVNQCKPGDSVSFTLSNR
jgi:hypothetical protein